MKEIELTRGVSVMVDDNDYEHLSQWKWFAQKCKNKLYAARTIWGKEKSQIVLMHRIIMETPSDMQVDHINGNTLDNRRINLRNCTKTQNLRNAISTHGVSKFKGVSIKTDTIRAKPYRATIVFNRKQYSLGVFYTEEEAAHAYDKKAIELFGDFANTNFSRECYQF